MSESDDPRRAARETATRESLRRALVRQYGADGPTVLVGMPVEVSTGEWLAAWHVKPIGSPRGAYQTDALGALLTAIGLARVELSAAVQSGRVRIDGEWGRDFGLSMPGLEADKGE